MSTTFQDDLPSIAAIGSLALITSTMVHEALGHGSVCLITGGLPVLHPFSMQCTVESPAMVAAGPIANAIAGLTLYGVLWGFRSIPLRVGYFLWLVMAYSLFNAAGYLGVGLLAGFGDWAVLLPKLPLWAKVVLTLFAAGLYYGFMHLTASAGRIILAPAAASASRIRRMVTVSYLAAGAVSCGAALLSPTDPVIVAAAASLGAGIGLLVVTDWGRSSTLEEPAEAITRSWRWIVTSLVITLVFVLVISRGLRITL